MHVSICPFRHFCCSMYRLAVKRTTKSEKCHKCRLWIQAARVHGRRSGNNDTGTVTAGLTGRLRVPCADCGLRTQICSNCRIRGLAANGFFFGGRDVAIAMNSVKIAYCMQYDRLSQQQLSFLFETWSGGCRYVSSTLVLSIVTYSNAQQLFCLKKIFSYA